MSFPQSRSDKSDNQYKKLGRSGSGNNSGNHPRGSSGRGGGGPVPPTASSLSSNRSFKKTNNAQAWQPRTTVSNLNTESSNVSAPQRPLQNGAHSQPPLQAADVPVAGIVKPADSSSIQKSIQVVPKAPSSQSSTMSADKAVPSTPAKSPGDVSEQFPLQFGSISPGFMNGMQIAARTSSAPPNLDEQKRDQARHQSFKAGPVFPIHSAPKPELQRKDLITDSVEAHSTAKGKKDAVVSSTPALAQIQKPMGVQMSYHQPHGSGQFSYSNLPIQAQGMGGAASHQMPLPMPMPIGNPSQMQQQMFISNLQPHPMQHQGLLHQAQALNFSAQMGPQIPPQLGNLVGMGMAPQYPQHIPGKYGSSRRTTTTVKITDPKTNMNVRLDQPTYGEGGAKAPKPLSNVPQSQPIPSFVNQSPHYSLSASKTVTVTENILSKSEDKHVEPSRAKNVVSKSKKKRKQVVQRANAARTTSDLYMAYKGPDEKKDVTISSESSSASPDLKQVATDDANEKEVDLNSKAVPEDWEDAVDISTPKLKCFSEIDEILTKKYSRDFILKFAEQCTDLRKGFEITSDIEPLLGASVNRSHHNDRDILSKSKDKHVEPSRAKNVVSNSKKIRKQVAQRANAAGTTLDLYMAYKGPDEKKDVTISSESSFAGPDLKQQVATPFS